MKKLLIILLFFGFSFSQDLYLRGDGYKGEFLGCLTCNKYDSESICNKYGTYGSKYSSESPWNKYSTNGPKIYNKEGEYYGRYTINIYDSDSSELSRNLKKLYEMFDGDLEKIRNTLCD